MSVAIAAFQEDLAQLAVDDRVIGMTFSEFGRRIKSNASGGTDHGTSVPMLVFGKNVQGGVFGSSPVIRNTSGSIKDNLDMQFDFRQVYFDILRDWFGSSPAQLQAVLGTPRFTLPQGPLGIISPSAVADVPGEGTVPREFSLRQNYPNPFNPTTEIRFELPRTSAVLLEVFNAAGQRVGILAEGERSAGMYTVRFDASNLSSGPYFYRLRAGGYVETKKALLVR
jgi:hypothetical protein